MKSLRIALLQISPCGDTDKNLQKGLAACRAARAQGADIALFPEMWSNGYNLYGRPVDAWKAEAIPGDGAFVRAFGALARELDMAVGVTLLERYGGGPRNTLVLFDRHGERKLTYAKVHTCDFDVERSLTPGDRLLRRLAGHGLRRGAGRRDDLLRPGIPRKRAPADASGRRVDSGPQRLPDGNQPSGAASRRAYENMLAVATCNYPAAVPDCNGHSTVFDGVAYLPELSGSRDTCIFQADENEGVYVADLNLERLRRYRAEEVHGNAYRRPKKYGLLTDTAVRDPFVRPDRRD